MKLVLLCCAILVAAVYAEAEAEADPACNNCGQRPPYIKGARVSTHIDVRFCFVKENL